MTLKGDIILLSWFCKVMAVITMDYGTIYEYRIVVNFGASITMYNKPTNVRCDYHDTIWRLKTLRSNYFMHSFKYS